MVENREFAENMEARIASGGDPDRDVIAEQITTRSDVFEGMAVVTSDGEDAGAVQEVRATHFLVDRSMARDVWIPYSAVADVSENLVTLTVASVDDQGWENPPLMSNIVV